MQRRGQPRPEGAVERALERLTCEVLLEGAAYDLTGSRVLLGGAIVESPAEVRREPDSSQSRWLVS